MVIPTCDATWDADFDDCYYGISSACDQPAHHRGDHAGPLVRWNNGVGSDQLQDGMRLSWPPGKDGPNEGR